MVEQPPPPDIEAALRKFQRELSSGVVALALLAVLSRAAEPMYGYRIAKTLERFGEGVLSGKQSALYPVLRNLEAAAYQITDAGRAALREWAAAWRATRDSVDTALEGTHP